MKARVRALTFPKSEHTLLTNEDACACTTAAGLFAVADGVGSASFSGEWARLLVEHFVAEPLLSDDPFEAEWWLRRAQGRYDGCIPAPESLPPFAQEKARQGGAATLVAMRLTAVAPDAVEAEVLAVGDSCAIVSRHAAEATASGAAALESFPLQTAAEFSTATVALPARLRYFDRHLHHCRRWTLSLAAGDTVITATDAVAKAILGGAGADGAAEAFAAVAQATEDEWGALVCRWRAAGALADDDATALVIELGAEGEELGCTTAASPALAAARLGELQAAVAEARLEAVAIAYGDGSYFPAGSIEPLLSQRARLVADAVAEVRGGIMRALTPRRAGGPPLAEVWQRWAPLLADEPSAANLRASLAQLGAMAPPRWPHLLAFREAIARADAESVVGLAPPAAMAYLLTECERDLVQCARDWLGRRERLRAALEAGELDISDGPVLPGGLEAALASDDDERIVLAVGPGASDDVLARAVLARERLHRLARIRVALASADDGEIVRACPDGCDDCPQLLPSERARIARARRCPDAAAPSGPAGDGGDA